MTTPMQETSSSDATATSVGTHLGELLEPVFADEPPLGDAVNEVFRLAEKRRRRRSTAVLAAGIVVVVLTAALGYALTTELLPTTSHSPSVTSSAGRPDPVLAVFAPVLSSSRLRIVPHEPARGDGWRQYLVLTAAGRPHGLVQVSIFSAPKGLCFPVLAVNQACARPERGPGNVEYVRYAFDRDVDWQVNEVIARRLSDGRTIALQATGERGTGTAAGGRPPLSALLTARTATDPRLAAAFGTQEGCHVSDPACPVLKVPVPVAD